MISKNELFNPVTNAPDWFIRGILAQLFKNLILSRSRSALSTFSASNCGDIALRSLIAIVFLHSSQYFPVRIILPQHSQVIPASDASDRIRHSSRTHCLICLTDTYISLDTVSIEE